ncbi:MAG: protein kinase [Planctomycetes bacterium]|nr:protein kinase [Planctomycetota bacterium]
MKEPSVTAANKQTLTASNRQAYDLLRQKAWISEDLLEEALHEWQQTTTPSLTAYLCDSNKINASQRDEIDRLCAPPPGPSGSSSTDWHPTDLRAGPPGHSMGKASEFVTQNDPSLANSEAGARRRALVAVSANNRYQTTRFHKAGGLSQIFECWDSELARRVAIKEIHHGQADDPDAREQFKEEACRTASLEHPSIIPIYDFFARADGRPHYVMRFVTGNTFREEIDHWHRTEANVSPLKRTLAFRKLLGHLVDVCDALHYAHSKSILHLDLKPENVMIGDFGETFVLDWGLSRRFEKPAAHSSHATNTGTNATAVLSNNSVQGTRQYMSPEQAQGRNDRFGPPTDVYGLGAILYYLLAGQPPRGGAKNMTPEELAEEARQGRVTPLHTFRRRIDRNLQAICMKALAYSAADRYATADDFRRDLERWLAREPVAARPLNSWHPERLLRLVLRYRYIALGVALTLPMLVIGLAFWGYQATIKKERDKNEKRIEDIFTEATSEEPSITMVLELLLKHYREEGVAKSQDPAAAALKFEKMAKLCEKMGTLDETKSHWQEAIQRYEQSFAENPAQLTALLNAKYEYARILVESGDLAEAEVHLKQLEDQLTREKQQDMRHIHAQVRQKLASVHKAKNNFNDAAKCLENSRRLLYGLQKEHGITAEQSRTYTMLLADIEGLYGDVKRAQGKFAEAETAYVNAKRFRKQVWDPSRNDGEAAIRYAWAGDNFLQLERLRGSNRQKLEKALQAWTEDAYAIRKDLFEANRHSRNYRREQAWASLLRGETLLQLLAAQEPHTRKNNAVATSPAGVPANGAADATSEQPAQEQAVPPAEAEPRPSEAILALRRETRRELTLCYQLAQQLLDEDPSNVYHRQHLSFSAIDLAYLDFTEPVLVPGTDSFTTRLSELQVREIRDRLDEAGSYVQDLQTEDSDEVYYKSALRLAILAELEARSGETRQSERDLRKAEAELRKAMKNAKTTELHRESELNLLRDIPLMGPVLEKLEHEIDLQ